MIVTADSDAFKRGRVVLDRIGQASKSLGITAQHAAERFVCEEISRGLSAIMAARHYVRGGCIFPQTTRETRDLDITFVRKISDDEFVAAVRDMTPMLGNAGIVVTKVHKPQTLIVGGDECMRTEIEVKVANAVIKINVDATGGPIHQPLYLPRYGQGSTFFKGQVPLSAHFQGYEAQAADKLASIVLRSSMAKWRHFADVSMLAGMGLDKAVVAEELSFRMRQRFPSEADIIAALPSLPEALDPKANAERAQPWTLWVMKHGKGSNADIDTMTATCRAFYTDVRQITLANFQNKLRPRTGRFAATAQARAVEQIRQQVWGKRSEINVIQMGDYRDPITMAFKPKM